MLSRLGLMPEAASTLAGQVDALYFFLIAVSLLFGIGIAVAVIVLALRYRRRSDDQEAEAQIEGSTVLELAWSIIPFGIAMVIFVWSASVYFAIATPPKDAMEIFVVGKQWMWKLQHMEGRREINELHVPVGVPIKLTMTSEDVIHSFYVPAFRVKADAVPGRYSTLWFEATQTGTFHLFCAEYCGTEHSRMIGRVVAMEPSDYQAWLDAKPVDTSYAPAAAAGAQDAAAVPLSEQGRQLFAKSGCTTCHVVEGDPPPGAIGPPLHSLYGTARALTDGSSVVADDTYLRNSILNPMSQVVDGYPPAMPAYQGRLSEEEVLQLIAYIKSLGSAAPAGEEASDDEEAGESATETES